MNTKTQIRVAHLITTTFGGAGRAVVRLHRGLRMLGVASDIVTLNSDYDDGNVHVIGRGQDFKNKFRRFLDRWRKKRLSVIGRYSSFSGIKSARCKSILQWFSSVPPYDIINLHWVGGMLDYNTFFKHPCIRMPIVWTLHDMAQYTGGCHYTDGCIRFLEHCNTCPQLGSKKHNDVSYKTFSIKKHVYSLLERSRMIIVANSNWSEQEANKSVLLHEQNKTVIPFGVDTKVFSPRPKEHCKSAFGIPPTAKVILFSAFSVSDKIKGMDLLFEALRGLKNSENVMVMTVGSNGSLFASDMQMFHVGLIKSDHLMSAIYNAADVFVIPSRQEAFGQTALEAMACGTPVVGFDVGGIRDIVVNNKTGLLVKAHDCRLLGDALQALLDNQDLCRKMGLEGRQRAESYFTLESCARKYISIYNKLLSPTA